MGFKKGTAESNIDNTLRAYNLQLKKASETFGTDSRFYQSLAFKATLNLGMENVDFDANNVLQIRRKTSFIREIAKNKDLTKNLVKLRNAKKVNDHKKSMIKEIKKNMPEFKDMSKGKQAEIILGVSQIAYNNIGEYLSKYKSEFSTDSEESPIDEMVNDLNKANRETNALIKDKYLEMFNPYTGDDHEEIQKQIGFNPVVSNETGEILSAEQAYNKVVKIFENAGDD